MLPGNMTSPAACQPEPHPCQANLPSHVPPCTLHSVTNIRPRPGAHVIGRLQTFGQAPRGSGPADRFCTSWPGRPSSAAQNAQALLPMYARNRPAPLSCAQVSSWLSLRAHAFSMPFLLTLYACQHDPSCTGRGLVHHLPCKASSHWTFPLHNRPTSRCSTPPR